MNKPIALVNEPGAQQPQGESHGGHAGRMPLARLLILVAGDCGENPSLMDRLLALQSPIFNEEDGLIWIEVPSPYAYFVFAGVQVLGADQGWHACQNDLDAAIAGPSRIIVAPRRAGREAELIFHPSMNAGVLIKTVSAQSGGRENVSEGQDPLNELLKVIAEFAEQENLLAHVGGY